MKHTQIRKLAKVFLPVLGATFLLLHPQNSFATDKEYRLKAAFLYQFSKLTKWPNKLKGSFTIGIIGDAPFGNAFDKYQNKKIHNKTLIFKTNVSLEEALSCCQLLYITPLAKQDAKTLLSQLQGKPVLTVGEWTDFIQLGGMINFVQKGTKQKFEANRYAAKSAGLKFSSRLLQVAIPVE